MNKKLILLVISFVSFLGFLSYRATYALFADSATSSGNTFTAAAEFPTPPPALKINELVSNPGTTFETEWVEIFNFDSVAVDLTGWSLDEIGGDNESISTLGTIGPGEFKIFDHVEGWLNNGGDTVFLKDPSSNIVDSHPFGSTENDESLGRDIDGSGSFRTCTVVTKNASNNLNC